VLKSWQLLTQADVRAIGEVDVNLSPHVVYTLERKKKKQREKADREKADPQLF